MKKLNIKNNIAFVLIFSVIVKGIGAVIEIIIQWLITQDIGVSGYGNYTFYINCGDIAFWCLFSGIVKCNTFYLSDKSLSISIFKKKYVFYFMSPIVLIATILITAFKMPLLYAVMAIVILQFAVNNDSSTFMARGLYNIALTGEYVIGRIVLLVGYSIMRFSTAITLPKLLIVYNLQYITVILFFLVFKKKKTKSRNLSEISVPIRKVFNYQMADVVSGLIGQAPIILQYVFVGSFETGFTGIVALVKRLVNFIIGPTAKVFLPEFSRLYKKGDYKKLRYNYQMIMRIQMLFINVLGVLLIGNTHLVLKIFSPELFQFENLFRIVAVVFLISSTLGPSTGLMQMTGNEKKDNIIRWASVVVMILTWIIMRDNSMFALVGMTVQVGLEGIAKYTYISIWFKKMPISVGRYLLMYVPMTISCLFGFYISRYSALLSVVISILTVLILSFIIELTDKNMRDKLYDTFHKIKKRNCN